MKIRRTLYIAIDISVMIVFVWLLLFPQMISSPVYSALEFCARTLIPSLFVYMVLARMIASSPAIAKLTAATGCGPVFLVLGTLCGCPVGATLAQNYYDSGCIGKKHAEYLLSFTNNASASFLIGFVGAGLFGDVSWGVRLFLCQLTASAVTAVVMKRIMFGRERLPKPSFSKTTRSGLREAITDSAGAMLNICACAVFFTAVSGALSYALGLDGVIGALLRSALEFSSGCAATAGLDPKTAFVVCAFACGQTGLSVLLQVRSVTAGKLSIKPYVVGKLLNCAVMTSLAYFIG